MKDYKVGIKKQKIFDRATKKGYSDQTATGLAIKFEEAIKNSRKGIQQTPRGMAPLDHSSATHKRSLKEERELEDYRKRKLYRGDKD